MKLSPHFLKRYKDISLLVLKYSRPEMVSKFGVEDDHEHVDGNGQAEARELSNDLERLGPTFVKLGQLLSSRADLLPERYLRALARLQDEVKPFPTRMWSSLWRRNCARRSRRHSLISIQSRWQPHRSGKSIGLHCMMDGPSL